MLDAQTTQGNASGCTINAAGLLLPQHSTVLQCSSEELGLLVWCCHGTGGIECEF